MYPGASGLTSVPQFLTYKMGKITYYIRLKGESIISIYVEHIEQRLDHSQGYLSVHYAVEDP